MAMLSPGLDGSGRRSLNSGMIALVRAAGVAGTGTGSKTAALPRQQAAGPKNHTNTKPASSGATRGTTTR
jgi:hypothetical protein